MAMLNNQMVPCFNHPRSRFWAAKIFCKAMQQRSGISKPGKSTFAFNKSSNSEYSAKSNQLDHVPVHSSRFAAKFQSIPKSNAPWCWDIYLYLPRKWPSFVHLPAPGEVEVSLQSSGYDSVIWTIQLWDSNLYNLGYLTSGKHTKSYWQLP